VNRLNIKTVRISIRWSGSEFQTVRLA